ncbi:MAG: M48 family metallopeptidase [Candidatus Riflebacteria bacterium]|nr:M48 family metallopeptidase [Candidatus Riflebacteria bacterium]
MKSNNQNIGGIAVEIIKKKKLKNLYIRIVPPDGKVRVTAPIKFPDKEIKLLILRKLQRINAARECIIAQSRQTEREYTSGEIHYLWGNPYVLEVINGQRTYQLELEKELCRIIFKVPANATKESKEKAFNNWYRQKLKRAIDSLAKQIEEKMGISANEYHVKNMKTRWGTCNITKRRIWINLQLAKKPIECLEYIITHELAHLLEKNHNKGFYTIVEKFCPTWKEAEKKLKQLN